MILLICILFFNTTFPVVLANENTYYYAQVMYDKVYLYKTPISDNNTTNIYFEIPKTYYVKLTDSANDSFYSATYLTFTGYVKKESVQAVANTPTSPYLDSINFRVYADLSRNLRSEPNISSTTSALIATVPLYSRNLTFYGKIVGETLIEGRTNIWYFCKYSADKDYYGYIYSDFCDELPNPLPYNTETVSYVDNPTFIETENQTSTNSINLNSNITTIIIGIITIPALIFTFMIVKNKNVLNGSGKKEKEIKYY